jgi:hypothetical protein
MTAAEAFANYLYLLRVTLIRLPHVRGPGGGPAEAAVSTAAAEALRMIGGIRPGTRGPLALRGREILDDLGVADALDEAATFHWQSGQYPNDFRPSFDEFASDLGVDLPPARRRF